MNPTPFNMDYRLVFAKRKSYAGAEVNNSSTAKCKSLYHHCLAFQGCCPSLLVKRARSFKVTGPSIRIDPSCISNHSVSNRLEEDGGTQRIL